MRTEILGGENRALLDNAHLPSGEVTNKQHTHGEVHVRGHNPKSEDHGKQKPERTGTSGHQETQFETHQSLPLLSSTSQMTYVFLLPLFPAMLAEIRLWVPLGFFPQKGEHKK